MDTKLNINAIEELSIPATKLKDPENLTTGFANDLTGRNEATAEEFTLRPSAGNISIRDDSATIKRIKGNSVVWNQILVPRNSTETLDGITVTQDGTGKVVVKGTATATTGVAVGTAQIITGHKYVYFGLIGGGANKFYWTDQTASVDTGKGCIAQPTYATGNRFFVLRVLQGITVDFTFYPQVCDLTQMFGVGNEPDTVEEFRALFPDNYYEYNPGQLVSMTANGLFTNGFNQWDEEWVNGYYRIYADSGVGNDGEFVENSSYIATAKPIKVLPNTQYYIKSPYGVLFGECDINGIYTGNHYYVYAGSTFTTSSNCFYLLFYVDKAITNATYNNDICINLSHTGVENGKYEPYWDATKDLSIIQKYFPNGMRSAGSIYDEISFDETTQKWVAIQRVGNVDLGSLSWEKDDRPNSTITWRFKTGIINNVPQSGEILNILSSKYTTDISPIGQENVDDTIIIYNGRIYIEDTSYTDAAAFKSALAGVILNYELAEPIITVIEEPVDLSYKVGDFGIEQTLSDSFSAPFRADIIYQFNATDRIRENSLNIEKLSKTQKDYLPLTGGTMSGQINSQDIKPVEGSTYQLGDSTHKYKNVFSDFFTGNLEGNAKTASDLTGRIEATPEVFTYHPSAGEKSIKDDNAFIRRVKGNSIVWNQLVDNNTLFIGEKNGMVISKNEDGSITFNGTASADIFYNLVNLSIPIGHKVALTGVDNMSPFTFFINGGIGNTLASSGILTCSHIGTNGNGWMFLYITANTTFNNVTINPKIHYLTRMFGVGNEPTTVEEFRALYPDSYYPYNAGELRNLDCSGIKTVGFNQWDEQWEVGQISSTTGNVVSGENKIISKNYIPVLPNTSYYLTLPLPQDDSHSVYYYDGNKNYIGFQWIARDVNQKLFTTPSNCLFIKFDSWGTTYNNDICINLHHTGYRDGEYEPYKEVTHSLPLSQITNGEPLRKAGSAYDEINETEYIKRVGVVDLGSLTYQKSDNFPNLFISKPFGATGTDADKIANLFCPKYITMPAYDPWKDIISMGMDTSNQLYIYDPQYTDIEAFKSAMSGIMLNYELAEPIVTPIETPIDFNYYVEDFGTEEALLTEDSAPFSADIVYQFNATDTIRVLEKNIKQLLNKIISLENTITNAITNSNNL